MQQLVKRGATPSGPVYGYKMVKDEDKNEKLGSHYSNPFNQAIRGAGKVGLQQLVKRGATPSGPVYGYKEVKDDENEKLGSHYSNPFNQVIRGAGNIGLQELVKRGATPSGPVYGYKMVTDKDEKLGEHSHYSNPFNQAIRGAGNIGLQQLESGSETTVAPVDGGLYLAKDQTLTYEAVLLMFVALLTMFLFKVFYSYNKGNSIDSNDMERILNGGSESVESDNVAIDQL